MAKLLIALVFMSFTYANLDQFCASKKGDTSHYKVGENYYIYKDQNLYKFEEDQIKLIFSKYKIMSVKEHGDKLYILTPDHIFVRDSSSYEYITSFPTTSTRLEKKHQFAQDMVITNDMIYVAHGSLGLTAIGLKDNRVEMSHQFTLPHAPGQVSTATGIDFKDGMLYAMLDNVTYNFSTKKRAFEGLVILDENFNQIRDIVIRQGREALHYPKSVLSGKYLISRNLQNLYLYETKKFSTAKTLWPKRRLFNFDGMALNSNPSITNGVITGCFRKYDGEKFHYSHRQYKY